MATTTTNFGWDIPQSTDLVKDGATAIAALGQDIDTALVDLKGGTTGQILAKASATDLDYSWITNDVGDITAVTAGTGISGGGTSGAVTITNSMATAITTAGDLIKGTGSGTFDRLGIGSAGQVLTVTAGAPAWATPAGGGGFTLISEVSASAASAISFTSISGSYKHLVLVWDGLQHSTTGSDFTTRLNNDATALYQNRTFGANGSTLVNNAGASELSMGTAFGGGFSLMGTSANVSSSNVNAPMGTLWIYDYASASKFKQYQALGGFYNNTATSHTNYTVNGIYSSTTAVTRLDIVRLSGSATLTNNADTSIRLYGVN
jgi:hypothetical protein